MATVGSLRERVTVQRRTNAPDAYGQPVQTWATVNTVWAEVVELSGDKPFGETPEATAQVTMRYFPGLDPTYRIIHGTTTYYIQSAVADPAKVWHVLLVQSKEV